MSDLPKIIGERLRAIRKGRGMTQEELSDLASLHPTYIGQVERGEKNVTLESLERITGALDVSFEELFQFLEPRSSDKNTVLGQIVSRLQQRSLEDQKTVLRMVDLLIEWKDQGK